MSQLNSEKNKVWIVTVSMGYGHQRAAYPLREMAENNLIIAANDYPGIPKKDRHIWESSRKFYEFISKFTGVPIIGGFIFSIFDKFQKIMNFYPKRNLSESSISLNHIEKLIKKGWGRHLIDELKRKDLPFLTTFFVPAFMAEHFDFPGSIYCVATDTDVARTWAPLESRKTRIKYFAPTSEAKRRLESYGIKPENIILSGFPLPKENIGTENLEIARADLSNRLANLDPQGVYRKKYRPLMEKYVGSIPRKSDHILTLMFSIGGAGAQSDIAEKILRSIAAKVRKKEIRLILAVGNKPKVMSFLMDLIKKFRLAEYLGSFLVLLESDDTYEYFKIFDKMLRTTDILWTKPSELSFYTGLGIPIIIAPPIGSQEDFNRDWLIKVGAGMPQGNPAYCSEWIFDRINEGVFAEAAMQGFVEVEKLGTFNIEREILGG